MLAPPLYVERLQIAYKSVSSAIEQLSSSSLIPADPAWLEQHSAKCLFQPVDSATPVATIGVAGNSGARPSPPPVVRCIASVCFETITQIDLKITRSAHPNVLYIGTLASAPTPWRLSQLQNAANLLHEGLLALNLLLERARRLAIDSTSTCLPAKETLSSTASSNSSLVVAASAPVASLPAACNQSPLRQTGGITSPSSSSSNPKLLPLLPTLYHRSLVQEALSKMQLARRTLECPARWSVADLLALRRDHPLNPPLAPEMAISFFVEETRLCLALYVIAQVGAPPSVRYEIAQSQVLESSLPSLLLLLPRLRAAIRVLEQLSCETL